jgi:membrane fusion protein (multidrug efflux system)
MFWARVALVEVATRARLEVRDAVHVVQSRADGRVVAAHAALGKRVRAGDVLLELDARIPKLRLRENEARLASLAEQERALTGEVDHLTRAIHEDESASAAAIREARARLEEARAAEDVAQRDLRRAYDLRDRKLIADRDIDAAEALAGQRRAQSSALAQAITRLAWTGRSGASDREARLASLRRLAVDQAGQLAELTTTAERLREEVERRIVRAPIDGVIGELAPLRPGSVLDEGDHVASVIPDGQLQVVAEMPPGTALGRVRAGAPAWLRLDGFPWAQYGSLRCKVRSIGSEVHDGMLRIELDADTASWAHVPLQHGLPGTLEIEVERVSPATLLLRSAGRMVEPVRQ